MLKFGIQLLFATFFEIIITILSIQININTSEIMKTMHPAILIIFLVELIISGYLIYTGYKKGELEKL